MRIAIYIDQDLVWFSKQQQHALEFKILKASRAILIEVLHESLSVFTLDIHELPRECISELLGCYRPICRTFVTIETIHIKNSIYTYIIVGKQKY